MSSPDPLTDAAPSSVIRSSRRVTRSQTSQRFYAMNTSPRKQTFELDVGNDISPQKIRVTVEAEDFDQPNVKRRLFQSPTPKRNVRRKLNATTTTVPLRGLTDDERGAPSETATPRRGRPRRSGTPRKPATPATVRPRRPATPGGRFVRSNTVSSRDVLQSDTDAAENRQTPRLSSNVKRLPRRKTMTPTKGDDVPSSLPRKKRGRPRKESILPSDIAAMAEQESTADGEVEDNASVAQTEDMASVAGNRDDGLGAFTDLDDDIWLATLSDQATPVARRWHGGDGPVPENAEPDLPLLEPEREPEPGPEPRPSQHSDADYSQPEEYMDFGGGMDSHSDVETELSEKSLGQGTAQDTAQDTVMTNEEFTMISIGSLPSMQPNSSMMAPGPPQELGEATSLIIHRTLEELRQSRNKAAQQDVITEETPAVTTESAEMSFVQQPEDSLFAQPKSPGPWMMRSPRRNKATPLAKQVAVKNLLQADSIDPSAPPPLLDSQEAHDTSGYDDSFSQIPEAVLEAATPRRPRQPLTETEDESRPTYIQPSIERPSIVNHSNPQSESNRLLTPDETPSIPSDDEGEKSQPSAVNSALDPAPVPEIRSSPPDASPSPDRNRNELFSRLSRTRSTETPTEKQASFRSPDLGALNGQHLDLAPPEPQRRPTLSPIVRAGRALQFITSDPPSPPNRDSVLRSPFRGSVAKSSPPAELPVTTRATESPPQTQNEESARPAGRSWLSPFTHIKDLVVQGAQALSPRPALVSGIQDPFGPVANASARPSSSRSMFRFRSEQLQPQPQLVDTRAPSPDRDVLSPGGAEEDEMSWQAESPSRPSSQGRPGSPGSSIHAAPGTSPKQDHHAEEESEQEQEHEMEMELDHGREPEPEPEPHQTRGQAQTEEQEEEEDEDIWAIEAQRPTPFTSKQTAPPREPYVFPPRRSKLPSPWRQNSKRLVYSDELQQFSDENIAPQRSEADEFSMLSQQESPPQPTARLNPTPYAAPAPKADLSAFFSSPAVLPDATQPGLGLFKALDGKQAARTQAPQPAPLRQQIRSTFQPPPTFGNSLFPQLPREEPGARPQTQTRTQKLPSIPQKEFRIDRVNRETSILSSPRREPSREATVSEPAQSPSPEIRPQTRTQKLPSVPQKEFHIDRVNRETSILSSPRREASREATGSEPAQSSSPPTPQRPVVPQKMNFTPRSRNAENTLFNLKATAQAPVGSSSLFGSAKQRVSSFFASTGPAAAAHEDDDDDDDDDYDEDMEEDDDDSRATSPDLSFEMPPKLNPAPNRAMSPTKSSFRSPMKPKTPGRVVEFTSSTLSPLAQAQARAEQRRAIASPEKEAGPAPPSRPALTRFSDKPKPKQLSTSQWTRDHWLRLDELLQARRKGMLAFQLTVRQGPTGGSAQINSTGAGKSHRLLGKQVTTTASAASDGEEEESMILEAWHLDIVEAFRSEVLNGAAEGRTSRSTGGSSHLWTDEVLAKRLFALMVGEERRAAGRVDRAARARRERRREQEQQQQEEKEGEEVRWY
ncbi:hypothetical protein V8F33_013394 [Rhypophila sp. PSN 637]